MDKLLKNCNTELFKVGDKVRIRQDIKELFALMNTDIGRYSRIFPSIGRYSRIFPNSHYKITDDMVACAGKTAEVTEIIQVAPESSLLSALYRLKINGRYSEWNWKHALLEKVEEDDERRDSTRFPLKVGDTVTVRRDIAKRRDKSGYIWSTVNGRKIKSPLVTRSMVSMAGEVGKITSIYSEGEDTVYTLAFSNPTHDGFLWSISCLEEFHDYKAYVEGNSGKKKAPRKKSEERGEDYYGDSREIIDDSEGLNTDFFFAYDYKGRKRVFPGIDGLITKIDVTIISGDETGLVYFVKDGKASRVAFDASVGTRFISYDDGTYTVEGKDNIKKWLSWSYNKDKANNVNYAIQHMIDFLGGDK